MRSFQKAFAGGEVTPEFFGRLDDAKYQTGLAKCRNCIVRPHGPIANRPGTTFVLEVKDSSKQTRLIPYVYSTTQTMVLEFGEGYIRFHTDGGTLLKPSAAAWDIGTGYGLGELVSYGGEIYYAILAGVGQQPDTSPDYWWQIVGNYFEVPTPYQEEDLFALEYVQSDDVLTVAHVNYFPMELQRFSATYWIMANISFSSVLNAPNNVLATATVAGGANHVNMTYAVTAVGSGGIEESLLSSPSTCSNNIFFSGNKNTITWDASPGAIRYNVYQLSNGLYGFMGQTEALSFVDDNIAPDLGKTPPIDNNPFDDLGDTPGAVAYYQGRRDFAGTLSQPQKIWMTRTGTESNLSYSIPTHDDDGIEFKISAREANTIRHIVPMTSLILLTSAAEYRITSVNSDAITPTSVSVTPQSSIGCSLVKPIIVNSNCLFVASRGGHVREMAYAWQYSGFVTGDLSLRAPHLFDNLDIRDCGFAKSPYPIAWFTSTSGKLLGLTYVPEQQVGAWHQHDSYTSAGMGAFESVCVVPEGEVEDAVYVVVLRTIAGVPKRYIERFANQLTVGLENQYFVDCGVSYSGPPITTISSGLAHLEGEVVAILADGAVQTQTVVTGGAITLEVAASKIQIGLPMVAQAQTLPLGFESEAFGQGRQKNIDKVWVRVVESSGLEYGPSFDADKLMPFKQRTDEPPGVPPGLFTGEEAVVLSGEWQGNGQVCIQQANPLPMLVTSMTLEAAIGA